MDSLGTHNAPSTAASNDVDEDSGPDIAAMPPPVDLGKDLDPAVRQHLHELLATAPGALGKVYAAHVLHPDAGPTELCPHTGSTNPGAVSNRLRDIYAVMNAKVPGGPVSAAYAASAVRSVRKRTTLDAARAHLANVLVLLEDVAEDPQASQAETAQLQADTAVLEKKAQSALQQANGVYVYTYPHYWKYPYVAGTQRRLLKVGRTDQGAWTRIKQQVRATGVPEDPLLLRVYVSTDAKTAEQQFHTLLDAAEHQRSEGLMAGREWFATTIEFCDTIASVLNLEILKGSTD